MSDKQITPVEALTVIVDTMKNIPIDATLHVNCYVLDALSKINETAKAGLQAASQPTPGMPSLDKPILTDEDVRAWEKSEHPVKGAQWVKGEYARLYNQLKADPEKKTPCFIDYDGFSRIDGGPPSRDICYVNGKHLEFRARGIGYGGAESWLDVEDKKEAFLKDCERLNVEWLDESPTAAGDGKEAMEINDDELFQLIEKIINEQYGTESMDDMIKKMGMVKEFIFKHQNK